MRPAQNLGAHFLRACAFDIHVNISKERLYTEIYRKADATKNEPRTATHTLWEPAQPKCIRRFHSSHLILKFTEKCSGPGVSTLIKHRPLHLP